MTSLGMALVFAHRITWRRAADVVSAYMDVLRLAMRSMRGKPYSSGVMVATGDRSESLEQGG